MQHCLDGYKINYLKQRETSRLNEIALGPSLLWPAVLAGIVPDQLIAGQDLGLALVTLNKQATVGGVGEVSAVEVLTWGDLPAGQVLSWFDACLALRVEDQAAITGHDHRLVEVTLNVVSAVVRVSNKVFREDGSADVRV